MKLPSLMAQCRTAVCFSVVLTLTSTTIASRAIAADGYGNIQGQIVLEGDIPDAPVILEKGDPKAKDPAVCAAETRFSKELIVDESSKGIKNVFVFIQRVKKSDIHPDLADVPDEPVVLDQVGCQFEPHAIFVRTGQQLLIKSDDPVSHNFHTQTLRNPQVNFIIANIERDGIPIEFKAAEILPVPAVCDIHTWMEARMLILDHPYAALTDDEGKFEIKNVPAGEHDFYVWHDRTGWVKQDIRKGFSATIKADSTEEIPTITIKVEDLKD